MPKLLPNLTTHGLHGQAYTPLLVESQRIQTNRLRSMSVTSAITSRIERLRRRIPRRLGTSVPNQPITWSARRLNELASTLPAASTYLEIGVQHGTTLEQVQVPFKCGVDPYPRFRTRSLPQGYRFYHGTSDDFFEGLTPNVRFDLVFLDGLHTWTQTYQDLLNAARHSHELSAVLIDDVLPIDEFSALPSEEEALRRRHATGRITWEWHGDVYKTLVAVERFHPELDFQVIEDFEGNSQAVVWWRSRKTQITSASDAQLTEVDSLNYSEVFRNGKVPTYFNTATEAQVLSRVETILRDRASSATQ